MAYKNPEDKIVYDRNYYATHKEQAQKNARAWYQRNREEVITSSKKHYENNKKRHFEQSARYRRKHPEQMLAHAAIANALKRGKIVKPKSCQDCGKEVRIESHHYLGYAKQHRLDVVWVCRRCHMERHRCK